MLLISVGVVLKLHLLVEQGRMVFKRMFMIIVPYVWHQILVVIGMLMYKTVVMLQIQIPSQLRLVIMVLERPQQEEFFLMVVLVGQLQMFKQQQSHLYY